MTRRRFGLALAAAAASGAPQNRLLPPERVRYLDPTTDFAVLRLTSPEHSSWLPAPYQRVVSRRRSSLLFSNDRTGSPQLYQMFLSTGEARQLTSASDLDSSSPTFSPDDRSVFFFDGPSLHQLSLATLRDRELYRVPQGWRRGAGFSISPAADAAALVETNDASWRIRRVSLAQKPAAATVVEAPEPLADPLIRPGHDEILFHQGTDKLMVSAPGGGPARALPLAQGGLGPAFWSGGGANVVYLNFPFVPRKLNALRECAVEANTERLLAPTSQFITFSPNSDASVFAGASASKAAPYVLILLRVTRRELTMCEHRSSDPARVAPVFSPDSQRIYFQSDRHGRPAIYSVALERLVEKTGN